MTAAATRTERLPRARARAIAIAAATLWLPCLAPLLLGMLDGPGHAAATFVRHLPLIPGILLPVLLRLDGLAFLVVAALPTLGIGIALYAAARELPRAWLHLLQGVGMVLIALEALGFAAALRA